MGKPSMRNRENSLSRAVNAYAALTFAMTSVVALSACKPNREASYEPPPTEEPSTEAPATSSRRCRSVVRRNFVPECVGTLEDFRSAEAHYELHYDAQRLVKMEHTNAVGTPVVGFAGCAHWQFAYSGERLMSELCTGPLGQPVSRYNYVGNKRVLVGADGSPAWDRRYNVLDHTLDEQGRTASYRFMDDQGKLRKNGSGVHAIWVSRNESGSVVDQAYYDREQQRAVDRDGVHRVVRQVDAHGLPTLVQYFDLENRPKAMASGEHAVRYERAENGNVTKKLYYDPQGNLVGVRPDGVAGQSYEWSEGGLLVRVANLDDQGNVFDAPEGYASARMRHDARGNVTERWYFDATEAPVALPTGQTFERMRYDDAGALTERWYFDANSQPVVTTLGYAAVTYSYNNIGYVGRVKYYDSAGAPALSSDGYAGYILNYDRHHRVVEKTTFDAEQRASSGALGYATTRYAYGSTGRAPSRTYFNERNVQVQLERIAILRVAFDADGKPQAATPQAPPAKKGVSAKPPPEPPPTDAPVATGRSRADARKRIDEAYRRIAAGEEFDEVAAELSDDPMAEDGPAPSVRTTHPKVVQDALLPLRPGSVSSVLEVDGAFLIVHLMQ